MSATLKSYEPGRLGANLRVPVRAYVASDSESRAQFSEQLTLHRAAVLERGGWWNDNPCDEWTTRDITCSGPHEVIEPVMATVAEFIRRWAS